MTDSQDTQSVESAEEFFDSTRRYDWSDDLRVQFIRLLEARDALIRKQALEEAALLAEAIPGVAARSLARRIRDLAMQERGGGS